MFGARGPATPCQPVLVKVLCAANYAPKYEGAPRPLPPSRTLPAAIRRLLRLNHVTLVWSKPHPQSQLFPSNNNFTQALLVLLVTNTISHDNDDNDDGPPHRWRWWCWGQWSSCWWWWMIEGMMTIVRFMVLQMRLNSPPSPDPPISQSYWQRAVLYRILYCATYSTVPHTVLGSPQQGPDCAPRLRLDVT